MDDATLEASARPDELIVGIEPAVRFLSTLFVGSDTILFRPIETWDEGGKKHSRVDYQHTYYRNATAALLQITVLQLLKLAARERLNLFFGVCPRLGSKGRFDLSWQIRTVRVSLDRHRLHHG